MTENAETNNVGPSEDISDIYPEIYGLQVHAKWNLETNAQDIVFVKPATYITFSIGEQKATKEIVAKLALEASAQINAHEKRKRKHGKG